MEPIVFELPSNGAWIVLTFIIAAVCVPLSLHVYALISSKNEEHKVLALGVFPMVLIIAGFFGYKAYAVEHAIVKVTAEAIEIEGMYPKRIIRGNIVLDGAKVLNLKRDKSVRLTRRNNGINLGGYRAGWFEVNHEGQALVVITDRSRVVYLPTREDYVVMLSMDDPEYFLETLRETWMN